MSAEIIPFEDWRATRDSRAALARWALRLRRQLEANMEQAANERQPTASLEP